MAITIDLAISNYGVPFAGAYFRIRSVRVERQRTAIPRHIVTIDVTGYATTPSSEDVRDVDFRQYFAAITDIEMMIGDSFLSKCYAFVMLQGDMAGSVAA